MNTALSWIKAYVPELDCTAQEYTDAMTLTGTKVEGFEQLDADLDKIVIGILCASVVAKIKITYSGGSSSVFKSALNAPIESI